MQILLFPDISLCSRHDCVTNLEVNKCDHVIRMHAENKRWSIIIEKTTFSARRTEFTKLSQVCHKKVFFFFKLIFFFVHACLDLLHISLLSLIYIINNFDREVNVRRPCIYYIITYVSYSRYYGLFYFLKMYLLWM